MHIVHERQNPTTSQIQSATRPVDPCLWYLMVFTIRLGQGLGSCNVSVSVSSRTKCATSRSRLGLGPMRLGSRLGLGLKGRVPIPGSYFYGSDALPVTQPTTSKQRRKHRPNTCMINVNSTYHSRIYIFLLFLRLLFWVQQLAHVEQTTLCLKLQ